MKHLSASEKLAIVKEVCNKYDITAYEIAQNTGLTPSGIHRILTGEVQKPRSKTLDVIWKYLEHKRLNSPADENYKVADSRPENYTKPDRTIYLLQKILSTIRTDNDILANGIKKVYINTEEILEENKQLSKSMLELKNILNH